MASNQQYNPAGQLIGPKATTWTTSGNTNVVTDVNITSTSGVVIIHTAVPAGFWKWVVTPTTLINGTLTPGFFTITSSDSESAGLAFSYKLI